MFSPRQLWEYLLVDNLDEPIESGALISCNYGIKKSRVEITMMGNHAWFPNLVLSRTGVQNSIRILAPTLSFNSQHRRILMCLMDLNESRYAKVRTKAQSILRTGFNYYPQACYVVLPRLIDALKLDPNESTLNHEKVKVGCAGTL